MKMRAILLVAFLAMSGQSTTVAAAELPKWYLDALKVDNPNQLAIYAEADGDCPITKNEMKEIISGVLIRSRVKPLTGDEWSIHSLYFEVILNCFKKKPNEQLQIYALNAHFGNFSLNPPVWYQWPYRSFGRDEKEGLKSVIKSRAEEAITDFIKANFDL